MEDRISVVIPAYNEEKTIARTLDSLIRQSLPLHDIVVVNNNSNDRTSDIVQEYQESKDSNSAIHLVTEHTKGTGFACNTGFYFAIEELKAAIVSRTDADTVPVNDWNKAIAKYFSSHPAKQLVSGPSYALRDEHYRSGDKFLWPLMHTAFRLGNVAITHSLFTARFAIGHNMAVRADAFQKVGGFPNGSIDKSDEDVELSKRIYDFFGFDAMAYESEINVQTSIRRIRQVGYWGLVGYYWNPGKSPSQKRRIAMTGGQIDKR